MQIYTNVNDPYIEMIIKQFLSEIDLPANSNIPSLQIKTTQESAELNLIILDETDEILDYLKIPLNKDSFAKRLGFWTNSYETDKFIDPSILLKLGETIELEQIRKIFNSFIVSSEKQFAIIKKALVENDCKHLFESAHYLKTSASIVGANYLLNFCEIAIEKTKTKESWTYFFTKRFFEIEILFQQTIHSFRP